MSIQASKKSQHVFRALSGFSPVVAVGVIAAFVISFTSDDFYLMELLVMMLLYAQFAASWDILSGYTEQPNFGHALFIGGAAYLAALLSKHLGLPPYVTVPVAGLTAGFLGLLIGGLTLRLRGPYFALSTIVFASVAINLVYLFWSFTGGEEGLTGIDSFTNTVQGDLRICAIIFLISMVLLNAFGRSRYGLVLRSTRYNEDVAEASGINTAYYKIAGFTVSGFFAGIGGAMYVHTHMQVGPGMLGDPLSILIVLLVIIGGAGTIFGPVIAAASLIYLNEWLRVVEDYRIVIFTGILIVLVYFNPVGVANSNFAKRLPSWIKYLIFGRRNQR